MNPYKNISVMRDEVTPFPEKEEYMKSQLKEEYMKSQLAEVIQLQQENDRLHH